MRTCQMTLALVLPLVAHGAVAQDRPSLSGGDTVRATLVGSVDDSLTKTPLRWGAGAARIG